MINVILNLTSWISIAEDNSFLCCHYVGLEVTDEVFLVVSRRDLGMMVPIFFLVGATILSICIRIFVIRHWGLSLFFVPYCAKCASSVKRSCVPDVRLVLLFQNVKSNVSNRRLRVSTRWVHDRENTNPKCAQVRVVENHGVLEL